MMGGGGRRGGSNHVTKRGESPPGALDGRETIDTNNGNQSTVGEGRWEIIKVFRDLKRFRHSKKREHRPTPFPFERGGEFVGNSGGGNGQVERLPSIFLEKRCKTTPTRGRRVAEGGRS